MTTIQLPKIERVAEELRNTRQSQMNGLSVASFDYYVAMVGDVYSAIERCSVHQVQQYVVEPKQPKLNTIVKKREQPE